APLAEEAPAAEAEAVAEAPAPVAAEPPAAEAEAVAEAPAPLAAETPAVADHGLVDLPIADVLPDPRPLRADLAIAELVESVREHGIIQPLIVTPDDASGKYVVIAGNRRLEAARQAGLQTVPAIIRPASPQQRIEWSLIENTQRSDLNALEQAEAFRSLLLHFNLDESQVGRLISHSEAHVRRMLGLLHLTDASKQALLGRTISEEHAHALSKIDIPEMQNSVLAFIIENNLGVRQVEDLVRRLVGHQSVMTESAQETTEAPAVESAEPVAVETVEAVAEQSEAPAVESAEPVAVEIVEADTFAPVVESVAAISYPVTSPEPALELAVQTQTAVETEVMVAEPMPVAQPDQAWEAALDEMVITPEAEPEAIREPDIEVMPVHDEHGVFDEARFKAYQGISLYERVTSDNPDNDRAWHTLGKYYSEVGQFDKAIEAINRAIAIDGTKDIYYYHLGQAYAAARRYLEAIRAFEQTVALNPQHVFAHCSLAGYYRKLGNDSEAIKHIEIALPNIRQEKAYNQACF
ncbi:MAG: ParB/RepB/Spo0J family partition protein, partial [Anaerolineales bacterium]